MSAAKECERARPEIAAAIQLIKHAKAYRDHCEKSVFAAGSDTKWLAGTKLDTAITLAEIAFESAGYLDPQKETQS